MVTRTSNSSGMRLWLMSPGRPSRPVEELGEIGENIEWIVEEKDNVFHL